MMDRQEDPQLELFSQANDFGSSKSSLPRSSFMRRLRNYEKGLLVTIGFIIIAIISFSLGVEKGRKMASSNTLLERASLPVREQPVSVVSEQREEALPVTPDPQYAETQVLVKKAQYTIQLASYKTKSYAQKEAELLKKKGLSPVVLTKGNYVVLCVGSFADRVAAESLLSELRKQKRYSGCLIRRL